jgi:hypothetical protein
MIHPAVAVDGAMRQAGPHISFYSFETMFSRVNMID